MMQWWLDVITDYPHGLVPVTTATLILGISPQRMSELIKDGAFTVIQPPEQQGTSHRFIPYRDLQTAPFDLNRGRPGLFGPKNRPNHRKEQEIHEHSKSLADRHLPRKATGSN